MTEKQVKSSVGILYAIATVAVIAGAILKLQHSPNGYSILIFGFIIGTLTSISDTVWLKRKNKMPGEQLQQKE